MKKRTFDLVCEQDHKLDRTLEWDGETPPDIIFIGKTALIKSGKYLSAGERWAYKIPNAILEIKE